jgi:Tfp pilus assembly protein PilV
MPKVSLHTDTRGSLLLEALLAGAVFSVLVMGIVGTIIYGVQSAELATRRAQAMYLANEGLEASRNIRDAAFANLVDGTYGISAGTQWAFSGSSDVTDIFTRAVTVATVDSTTKQITSNVSWQQNQQRSGSVSLITYLTNWMAARPNRWSIPSQQSALDMSGTLDGVKVQIAGNYAYVIRAGTTTNFAIVDISTPSSPTLVGSLTLAGTPVNIAILGSYAYVSSTTDTTELQVVNVATPTAPVLAGSYNAAGNTDGAGIFAVGSVLYLGRAAGAAQEFHVINIATPTAPALLGSLAIGGAVNEVYLSGNFAYLATSVDTRELAVVNVATPTAPVLAGSLDLTGTNDALAITGYGTTVFAGRLGGSVVSIGVATPASPSLLATLTVGGNVNDLSLGRSNTYLFSATSSATAEFTVFDVTTVSAPTSLGILNLSANLFGVAYDSTRDRAIGVGADDALELRIFRPN